MIDQKSTTCSICNKRIDLNSKFCPHCGAKQLQEVQQQGIKTEQQFVESIASNTLIDSTECEKAWNESLEYLNHYQNGEFVFDILISAEIAKATLAHHRMLKDGKLDYLLYDMNSYESLDDIFIHEPIPLPKEISTGFHIGPLSFIELEELALKKGITATAEELDKGFRVIKSIIQLVFSKRIKQIKEAVDDKYDKKLVSGKSKAEIQKLNRDDLSRRATDCYNMFQENNIPEAANCFRHMTDLDPYEPYNHNMLHACYKELGEYEQALEEILYASDLYPYPLYVQGNLIMIFRQLGLYVEAINFFTDDEGRVMDELDSMEEIDSEDSQRTALLNTIWHERKLAFIVFNGLVNNFFIKWLTPKAWPNLQKLVTVYEKKAEEIREKKSRSLEGTNLFISYRRKDSGKQVDQMCELFKAQLPDVEVFRDISSISIGQSWLIELEKAIKRADIILVVIGEEWAGGSEKGRRSIDDQDDVLRREISLALKEDVIIIPVLLDDTFMPNMKDLPSELRGLAQTQASLLRPLFFKEDLDKLVSKLTKILKPKSEKWYETFKAFKKAVKKGGKAVFSEGILWSSFKIIGSWECKFSTPEANVELLFDIRHDHTFKGKIATNGGTKKGVEGNVLTRIKDGETLLGLQLEGITEDVHPFTIFIPIDKKLGEGYYGIDESGGSYFLRLIERTKEGL